MIKIIKSGNHIMQPKIQLATKCILCNCSFEFELEDLKLSYVRFSDNDVDLQFSIHCPQCQTKTTYDYYKLCDSISNWFEGK